MSSPPAATATAEQVLALEDGRIRSTLDADCQELERLFADPCTYVHSNGSVDDKRSYLEKIRAGEYAYQEIDTWGHAFALSAATAAVTFRQAVTVVAFGKTVTMSSRATAVWVDLDRGGKLLAFQATPTTETT